MKDSPILVIGAGPSNLMAAQVLAEAGYKVIIFEKNKAAARKFLVAGHGGFNLTHSESIDDFVKKYDAPQLEKVIRFFDNQQTISWLKDLGIETYIGSSGKIFPTKSFKPIQVLQAWLDRLQSLGVEIHYEHQMVDFDNEKVKIQHKEHLKTYYFDKLIIGLGGGSWQKTGSDAKWIPLFEEKGIKIKGLAAANSGYNTSEDYSQLEGQILKNIEVQFDNIRKKGELVFTSYGIEGSPIYYLNRFTRMTSFPYSIVIDLKPNWTEQQILEQFTNSINTTTVLKEKLNLNKTAIALLKTLDKETFTNHKALSQRIKKFQVEVTGFRPIDEVISTAGGILFDEMEDSFALKKLNNVYCIGEMLDWEAPTGGYLLQACFSMGAYCAKSIIKKTRPKDRPSYIT